MEREQLIKQYVELAKELMPINAEGMEQAMLEGSFAPSNEELKSQIENLKKQVESKRERDRAKGRMEELAKVKTLVGNEPEELTLTDEQVASLRKKMSEGNQKELVPDATMVELSNQDAKTLEQIAIDDAKKAMEELNKKNASNNRPSPKRKK